MLKDTHLYISNVVAEEVKGDNIDLNKRMFILGSIIPDYSPMHKVIRHYLEDSLDYIKKLTSKIVHFTGINKVSFYLGVVAHYISDYFCSPHYNDMSFLSKDVFNHIKYERDLDIYVKEKTIDVDIKTYNFNDLKSLVNSKVGDYNNKVCFMEDLTFAINSVIDMLLMMKSEILI